MRLYGPSVESSHVHALHDYLVGRGWVLGTVLFELDENGYPDDPQQDWYYAASFRGISMNSVDDATPSRLSCGFDSDDAGLSIRVGAAGNWKGCPDHDETSHSVDVDEKADALDFPQLGVLLDRLEPVAAALDPRELIECRFFGPCGQP
ncbi:hypothetical protein [Nocardia salmonicida]|uniref:hypothetical protein n=1 Tax=Nocardia salmonicida TaxID=53431 RepID=UPI0033F541A2